MGMIVVSVISAVLGGLVGAFLVWNQAAGHIVKWKKMSDKYLTLFSMMSQWVKVKQQRKNLSAYFESRNYQKIAIYGMSFAGEALVSELTGTNVNVLYGIDQNAAGLAAAKKTNSSNIDDIPQAVNIVSMEDTLVQVDAVVVTAVTFFDEIKEKVSAKLDCPVVSLEDILFEV